MFVVQVEFLDEAFTPTDKTEIGTISSWSWADIEDLLSAEWEIGGAATPTGAICGLVASK
jgi:hypothetical protein